MTAAGYAPLSGPLELVAGGPGYELRAGERLAGVVVREGASGSGARAEAADGVWRFAGGRGGSVVVTDAATGEQVAALRRRGISGARGRVTVGGRTLDYRSSGVRAMRWELLDDGSQLVEVVGTGALHERFSVALADPRPASLLVLIACYGALQSSAAAAASASI